MSKVRYAFFDLDDTLLTTSKKLPEDTLKCLAYLRDRGITVGVNTGRSWESMEYTLSDYDVADLFAAYINDGGINILDRRRGIRISRGFLNPDKIREVCAYFSGMPFLKVTFQKDGKVYANGLNDAVWNILRRNRKTEYIPIDPARDYEIYRIILCFEEQQEGRVREVLQKMNIEGISATITETSLCNINSSEVSKLTGMKDYLKVVGGAMDELMFFGDSDIDIPLLREAGYGVCMVNGFAGARAAAGYVTDKGCDEDGAADFIYKHLDLFDFKR